jgi:hypothetical protein
MAVTSGLIWTGALNNDLSNPGNYFSGDATSVTVPSAATSVIIPISVTNNYPVVYGTQNLHGIDFTNYSGYSSTPSITINPGAELRLTASATYKSFISKSGFYSSTFIPKVLGLGTLRFNEGGLNTGDVTTTTKFYGVVAVRSGVTVASNGFMRFENNSVLLSGGVATGDITKNYSGTVTGNITYIRSAGAYGSYNYWGSPVTGANTNALFTSYGSNLYAYDNGLAGGSFQGGWGSPITSPVAMTPGKGFIQTYAGNGTVTFVGTANQNAISYPVTVNGSNNFNLLSNPYPSALSYSSFKASNSNLGAIYLWSYSGIPPYNTGSYVVMSGLGVLSGNPVPGFNSAEIGAAQGFLAQVSSAGTVSFNSNQRVPNYPGNSPQFLDNDNPYSIVRLRLTNPNAISYDALVGFGQTGTDGVDFGFDAPRMPSSDVLELYSLIGDQQYTAQYLPELNTARVVELGTVMSESGTHTFELNLYENFDASVRVYLEDRKTGTFHNLNANPAYSFDNDPSFEGNRFRLHFMAPFAYAATGSCTNENTGKVIINNPNSNYPMKARIKNTSGQIVMQKDSVMAEYIFTGLAPQSYTLETSYDQSEYASTLIDVQGFEAFADIHFNSSAQSASIDQAIIEFEANTAVAAEYTWNFGDGTILVAGAQVAHAYMQTGIYTVTLIINNGGCTSQYSSEISITENVTGITELGQKDQLIAFPNPANEQINILRSGSAKANLELSDVTGKVVLSTLLVNKVNTINTAQLEAGTYMATIRQNGTVKTVKVVVMH